MAGESQKFGSLLASWGPVELMQEVIVYITTLDRSRFGAIYIPTGTRSSQTGFSNETIG